ncbi:hypothetical protein [Paraburkholderia sp. JHI869]|uniref:hypothetical protein n=1 Tax=Paraburkholderia sp. JHI869 TaxID=3112959 RepID=UPI00316CA96C
MKTLTFAQRPRAEETIRREKREFTIWGDCARMTLVVFVGILAGCSNGISDSDIQFVTAAMPPQIDAFRMYGAVPQRDGSSGTYAHGSAGLQQGCEAIIHSPGGNVHESVVLDSASAAYVELDVSRTPGGWSVTTDGLTAPSDNSVGLRTQFTNCLSAIQDKYRAEPEKVQ